MELALARFEQYLNRRFGQSSTPKHYLSDLRIFISGARTQAEIARQQRIKLD